MSDHHRYWENWLARLRRLGVAPVAAAFLEAAGPLNLLGAQLLHFTRPVLDGLLPAGQLDALAGLLDDDRQTQDFVTRLRENQ